MRFRGINIITPSQALAFIENFNQRIDRLVADNYSNPRFRTQDLKALQHDLRNMTSQASIAVHNKNPERAKTILQACSNRMQTARKLRDDYDLFLWKKKNQ